MPLEIALLHRAHRCVDDHEPDLMFPNQLAEIVERAGAEEATRSRAREMGDFSSDYIEAYRLGKPDCFLQPRFHRTPRSGCRVPRGRRFRDRVHDEGTASRTSIQRRWVCCAAQDSAISLFCSKS